jgi:hypothetical protein
VFPHIELWLASLLLCFLFLGGFSISLARSEHHPIRAWWGRALFILVLVALGATGLIGAFLHAEGLAPVGLLGGLLVVAMLWEGPPSPFREARIGEEG